MALKVNPTRMELARTKKRLKTAVRGHKLLKDKQDEMARRFMTYIRKNKVLRSEIEQLLAASSAKMALAQAEMGESAVEEALLLNLNFSPSEKYEKSAEECTTENIMSVDVPKISPRKHKSEIRISYGFAFSSEKLDGAVLAMDKLMPKLYELAEVEKTCDMLADEMQRTRRRINALEHVMIPEMQATVKYITMKLEDNERGNLTRLMKVKEMMREEV